MGPGQFLDVVCFIQGIKGSKLKNFWHVFQIKIAKSEGSNSSGWAWRGDKADDGGIDRLRQPAPEWEPFGNNFDAPNDDYWVLCWVRSMASDFAQLEPTHLSLPGGILPAKLVRDMSSPVLELRFIRRNFAIQNLSRA